MQKKWQILGKSPHLKEAILKLLYKNRGLKTKKQINEFISPPHPSTYSFKDLGISMAQIKKALSRIKKAIKNNERIIVYSDYDADGICGAAILWETLHNLKADVFPYIPHREAEGYGLSEIGIDSILSEPLYTKDKQASLIITVDHGIVAQKALAYAKKQGLEVIVVDHHEKGDKLKDAYAVIHTTKLCGAGVAWYLCRELDYEKEIHLDLMALATVADMVPLKGANRSFVKYGLDKLRKTKRPGLLALYNEAGLKPEVIGTYEIGFMIAPRLNAMGRLEHALDALRILCTKDSQKADELAAKLGLTNRERQQLTEISTTHAKNLLLKSSFSATDKLIFIAHESYKQGVIGLVAGRLCEEYYRPAIVVSKGEEYSKASARSISGFNIIETIRKASDLLLNCGGHPMAAGFTIKTDQLKILQRRLIKIADNEITDDKLFKTLKIECEINLSDIAFDFYKKIQELSPFGMGNPEPIFTSRNLTVINFQLAGLGGKHLKLYLADKNGMRFEAIGFGMGSLKKDNGKPQVDGISLGKSLDLAFVISLNSWNGREKLQLKLKDIKLNNCKE